MHFGSPVYLLALIVLPLVALFAIFMSRRRGRYPVAFTNLDVLAAVASSRTARKAWIPLVLLLLALGAAAAAFARPNVTKTKPEAHSVVVLLVDVSGSMAATDVAPNRITAAVNAMQAFIAKLPKQAEIGLVEFSTTPSVVELPTTDHETVAGAVALLAPQGATALGDGLGVAVNVVRSTLAGEHIRRVGSKDVPGGIVLLSDGAQNRGILQPLQAAARARAAGIPVDTIAFGTPGGTMRFEGVLGSVPVPPDPATMRAIASVTGGQTYTAKSAGEASSIFGKLGTTIARKSVRHDLTSWFSLGAGLLLIGAVAAGLATRPLLP